MTQAAKLTLNLGPLEGKAREGAVRGLRLAMEHGLQVSRAEVPHEEGTLERSGTVSVDETDLVGAVSFDGPYALRQHEDLTYRHDAGRKAKYLEDPWNREQGAMLEIVAAEVRRSLS
ncbi:hypothetical protein Ssi03_25880 [Sphaerisporangium siamense]|uniref:HK97 gp10 family phage protein n=1 Tax=Sphaerisporangium siamense TaxID=795645 RepID=A0A7W7D690_9ACTN|nr:hypothetical protein [Sphaerisporangium siamense]MBB4700085.1 hypothetical protein [Sphaerisporangium siamense]GII84598.1 hypothetical protein Ssi03_25880 [Sphaerisporangium siamense]